MSRAGKNDCGFTLFELLIVIALMALIVGMALPRIGGKTGDTLETAIRAAVQELERTRLAAMRHGRPMSISAMELQASLPAATVIEVSEEAPDTLVFLPSGGSSGARWQIRDDGESRILKVDWLTGRIVIDAR